MKTLCAFLLSATSALAHTAPTGWSYDASCCSNKDCTVIAEDTVQATPDGWLVTLTHNDHDLVPEGETYSRLFRYADLDPSNDKREPKEARRSGDPLFHACVAARQIICLYEQQRGF